MPRNRAIMGFGPTKLSYTHSSTATTGTAWIKFGPFDARKFGAVFVFGTATSGAKCKVQALVSTESTASVRVIATQTGNNSGVYKHSSHTTGVFSFVRAWSTGHARTATGVSVAKTVYFNAMG